MKIMKHDEQIRKNQKGQLWQEIEEKEEEEEIEIPEK